MAKEIPFRRALTVRSFGASLFAMVMMGGIIHFGGSIEGAFLFVGEEAMPIPALWMCIAFTLVSGLVFLATRKRLFTRAEMFFILFSCLIASPLVNAGFWRYMLGRLSTVPKSADFEKIDALNEKLWAHGPNITQGLLESSSVEKFEAQGNFSIDQAEIKEGVWANIPTLENPDLDDFSSFEILLPLKRDGKWQITPGQPYILSVLIRTQNVDATSTYFCRVFPDDQERFLEEAFLGSGNTPKTYLQKTGFQRFGTYGLVVPFETEEKIRLQFGLSGRGKAVFRDLQIMNVAAVNDAYGGTEAITEAEYAQLPASHRIGKRVRPDKLLSFSGIRFLLSAYVPLKQWVGPFCAWGSLLFCLIAASFAFSVIMRRQWVDRERFLLPLMQIPRFLIGFDGEGDESKAFPPIWKNWVMWATFAPVLIWCLLRGYAYLDPSFPNLSINLSLKAYFTDPAMAEMMRGVNLTAPAFFLGLALFMDLNITMSLVLGYFLFRSQYWFGEAYGWNVNAGYPWFNEQIAGNFITYAILILILSHRHIGGVLKEAIRGIKQPDEVFSSRTAVLIIIASFAGVALWSRWMDIKLQGLLTYFAFLFAITIVTIKLRAECGVVHGFAYPIRFWFMVPIIGGAAFLGPQGSIIWLIFSITIGVRAFFNVPGLQFEMLESGRRLKVRPRHILYTGLMGLFGGLVVGGWMYLIGLYGTGANYYGDMNSYDLEIENFGEFVGWHAKATEDFLETDEGSQVERGLGGPTWALIVSGGGTALVTLLRQAFAGFWFHPIGFILAPSVMMQQTWGAIFLAFLIRFLVLKLGSAQMVREKLYPAAIGILLGSVTAHAGFFIVNAWLYHYQPGTWGIPLLFGPAPTGS